uniref:Protein kinase domain-containing protein n=1 Tax=Oreochromis niloticus TaxID=8128 RepID=A0A669C641_ORENI
MLGIPYDEAIDMWALGLVAVELATGVPLYPGEDDYDVLKFIIETQGQLPDHLLESDHHMVESFLGEGGFGVVTRCRNTKNNQIVAIKVNKSYPEILQQAKHEIFILEQLQRLNPDRCNIVEWNGYFLDGERICLNFELLDQSLWDYIGGWNNQGLPIRELRPILHQIANALFHLGSVGIVHADLKPANIMVVNRHESPVKVKLIDFGLACPASAVSPGYRVGTVGYCAPEVMLGIPYDEAIDMWALGLVAVELATGVPLYPGEDDYDVLKFIIETQEQFQYETNYQSKETRYIKLKRLDDLEQLLKVRRGPENGQQLFVRLIKQMLALDANQRITPSEVLKHPFFNTGLSRSAPCTDMNTQGEKTLWSLSSLQAGKVMDRKNSTAVSKTQLNILKKDTSTPQPTHLPLKMILKYLKGPFWEITTW